MASNREQRSNLDNPFLNPIGLYQNYLLIGFKQGEDFISTQSRQTNMVSILRTLVKGSRRTKKKGRIKRHETLL